MTLTRALAGSLVLTTGVTTLLAAAEMDSGDLDPALALELIQLGLSVVDPTNVTDAELAAVPAGGVMSFLEWVLLRLKRTILAGLLTRVDQSTANDPTALGQMARGLAREIESEQDRLTALYRSGLERVVVSQLGPPCRPSPPLLPQGWAVVL